MHPSEHTLPKIDFQSTGIVHHDRSSRLGNHGALMSRATTPFSEDSFSDILGGGGGRSGGGGGGESPKKKKTSNAMYLGTSRGDEGPASARSGSFSYLDQASARSTFREGRNYH